MRGSQKDRQTYLGFDIEEWEDKPKKKCDKTTFKYIETCRLCCEGRVKERTER